MSAPSGPTSSPGRALEAPTDHLEVDSSIAQVGGVFKPGPANLGVCPEKGTGHEDHLDGVVRARRAPGDRAPAAGPGLPAAALRLEDRGGYEADEQRIGRAALEQAIQAPPR